MSNIQIKNSFLEEVSTYELVGIPIDQELTFDIHVEVRFSNWPQFIGIRNARYVLFFLEITVLLYNTTIKRSLCIVAPSGEV